MPNDATSAADAKSTGYGLTVKQAAELMNVSERQLYKSGKLLASGRQDLIEAVEFGKMTLHAAFSALDATPPRKDGLKALVRAWNAATVEERVVFKDAVSKLSAADVEPQICSRR